MAKKPISLKVSKKRGSSERKALAYSLRTARKNDRGDLVIRKSELSKRIGFVEYVDMVLKITKR